VPAVAYRVATADGAVVISGDTAVCPEVEALAAGADVLVHEALRRSAVTPGMLSDPEAIAAYHADTIELGAMAARAEVRTLVLTHLIPPPRTGADVAGFEADVRRGGFPGQVVVADDLCSVPVGPVA
jgi:ribonuclease Z